MELPGVGQLFDELDKKVVVYLRDGRTLIGILRSIDQFANLVLHRSIERIHVGRRYGDLERGVIIIRGENVVLLGSWDQERADKSGLTEVSVDEILEAQRYEQFQQQRQQHLRSEFMKARGINLTPEIGPDDMY